MLTNGLLKQIPFGLELQLELKQVAAAEWQACFRVYRAAAYLGFAASYLSFASLNFSVVLAAASYLGFAASYLGLHI